MIELFDVSLLSGSRPYYCLSIYRFVSYSLVYWIMLDEGPGGCYCSQKEGL